MGSGAGRQAQSVWWPSLDRGVVPLNAVGGLMMRDRGIRFLLYCLRDPSLSINFPCCIWDKPDQRGYGTKYSQCRVGVTAHRAPEGFWHSGSVGNVYNADTTGIA